MSEEIELDYDYLMHKALRTLMRDVLEDLGPAARLPSLCRRPVHAPASYVRRLLQHAGRPDVWTTTYQQILDGDEPVYRFVESTGLRPVREALEALGGDDRAQQMPRYLFERNRVPAQPRPLRVQT